MDEPRPQPPASESPRGAQRDEARGGRDQAAREEAEHADGLDDELDGLDDGLDRQ